MAEYLVFDAVVGNVDRHHENWGILRRKSEKGWERKLAPSFDHASALGRELADVGGKQNRLRYLETLGVEKYAKRGRGAVFINGGERPAPSPLELIRWCCEQDDFSIYFQPALSKAGYLSRETLEGILANIPQGWTTDLTTRFIASFVEYNISQLQLLSR